MLSHRFPGGNHRAQNEYSAQTSLRYPSIHRLLGMMTSVRKKAKLREESGFGIQIGSCGLPQAFPA